MGDTELEIVPDSLVNSIDSTKVVPSVVPSATISDPSTALAELIKLWLELDASAKNDLLAVARELSGRRIIQPI